MINNQSIVIEKISCEEVMDISVASELYKKLKKSLDMNVCITIDAENVERVDTAILQVFYSFFNEATSRGVEVSWNNPSESLRLASRLIGVDEVLRLN